MAVTATSPPEFPAEDSSRNALALPMAVVETVVPAAACNVRTHLANLELTEADVAEAVAWARGSFSDLA
jgi:hypothetical protein